MGCVPSKKSPRVPPQGPGDGSFRQTSESPIVCVVNRHRLAAAAAAGARPEAEQEEVLSLAFPEGASMAALFQVVVLHAVVILEKTPQQVRLLEVGAKDWSRWWRRSSRPWRLRGRVRGTEVLILPPGGSADREQPTSQHAQRAVVAAESWDELLRRMWMLDCPAEQPHHAKLLVRCKVRPREGRSDDDGSRSSSGSTRNGDSVNGDPPCADLVLELVFLPSRLGRRERREAGRKLRKTVDAPARRRLLSRSLEECVVWPRLELKLASQGGRLTTIHAVLQADFALQSPGGGVLGGTGGSCSSKTTVGGRASGDLGWGHDELALSLGCVSCPSAVTVSKQEARREARVNVHGEHDDVSQLQYSGFQAKRLGLNNEVRIVQVHVPAGVVEESNLEDELGEAAGGLCEAGLYRDQKMGVDAVWNVNFHRGVPFEYEFRLCRSLFVRSAEGTVVTVAQMCSKNLTLHHYRSSKFWRSSSTPAEEAF